MARREIRIAPSILSADFTRLGEQLVDLERAGADRVHVDVMDGHFVPPITLGPLIVEAACRATSLTLEAHLMIENPERQIDDIIEAGARIVIVHQEATPHLYRLVEEIKAQGARAGVALNPATPVDALQDVLDDLDLVLVMTVNPGYAGQAFIERMLPKIRRMRELIDEHELKCDLEVDGGIGPKTAPRAAEAGADVLVAASAIFQNPAGLSRAVAQLRASIQQTR